MRKMNVVMIYDQIQAGVGTKDDKMVPLQGKKATLGPAVMMESLMKDVGGHVVACLYCGTGFFQEDRETNSRKLCGMVQKMGADVVICGPCFNYKDYAEMAAQVAVEINTKTAIPAISAMAEEVADVIQEYKDRLLIVKMPKKGGTGLNDALRNILKVAKIAADKGDKEEAKINYCYK